MPSDVPSEVPSIMPSNIPSLSSEPTDSPSANPSGTVSYMYLFSLVIVFIYCAHTNSLNIITCHIKQSGPTLSPSAVSSLWRVLNPIVL